MKKEEIKEIHPWAVKESRADFTYDKQVKEMINAMCLPKNKDEYEIFGKIIENYIYE